MGITEATTLKANDSLPTICWKSVSRRGPDRICASCASFSRFVSQHGQLIHLPTWVVNCHNVMSKSSRDLREELGREPTPEEIAEQLVIDTDSKASQPIVTCRDRPPDDDPRFIRCSGS